MGLLEQTGKYIFKREAYRAYRGALNTKVPSGCFDKFLTIGGAFVWIFVALIIAITTNSYMFIFAIPFIFTSIALIKKVKGYYKQTKFTYANELIRKTDMRYKGGYKIVGSRSIITSEVPLTDFEIPIYKAVWKEQIVKWGLINGCFSYCYDNYICKTTFNKISTVF